MHPLIRPVSPDEIDDFTAVLEIAAGRHLAASAIESGRASFEPGRALGAFDGDRIVGGTSSQSLEITVPGAVAVKAAKITLTGMLPGYRGIGAASALMRRQLSDLRAGGEPLAILTAAQSGVPDRHCFGIACMAMAAEWRPSPPGPRRAADLLVRLAGDGEAQRILPALFDQHRRGQPGQVSRPAGFWASWFRDEPVLRTGGSERFILLAENAAGPAVGYLTYRLDAGPLREQPIRELIVEDLITVTNEARRALWDFCCHFNQAALVSAWNLPADEPLAWTVPDPRSLRVTALRPFLRLRLVDVAGALAARRYAAPGSIVLDVTDPILAGNTGRYLLQGGPDGAECTTSGRHADLALSVRELAAAYLGGTTFGALARAGHVTEFSAGALDRADAMFASRPAPWTVTDW